MQLTGIHHLTAVTARAAENVAFYTGTSGLRLVKKTVNQDDVSAYHLFYADGLASPGTDITFFDWPAPRERRGSNSITRTHLRVPGEGAVAWWHARLREAGIVEAEPALRDGRLTFDFEDPEGQRLALVDDGGDRPGASLGRSPGAGRPTRSAASARSGCRCRHPSRTAAVLDRGARHAPGRARFETRRRAGRGLRDGARRPGRRDPAPGPSRPRRRGRVRARCTTSPSAFRMRITTPGPTG